MTTVSRLTMIALLTAACACFSCGADAPAPAPVPAEPTPRPVATEPTVIKARKLPRAKLPDGAAVKLELAISQEEVSQGLMFRPSLAEDRGMLFLFKEERIPSFWMKNTLIPLDIIYLDARGIVLDITHDAQPCKADPCPQYIAKAPALAVLELAAGNARAHGVVEGARIIFKRVPDYPKKENKPNASP